MSAMGTTLRGSRALVIGGGSGIGYGSARLLARDGATVTIAGRGEQKLLDAVAALASEGLETRHVACDVMNAADVRAAVDAASDDGRLHIAVVVPGGGSYSPVLLYGDEQFGAEVDANVRPVFLTLKYAGQAMVRAGGGAFVAVSSTAADFSSRFLASYAAGKAAVDQLVRVAADELRRGAHPGELRATGTDPDPDHGGTLLPGRRGGGVPVTPGPAAVR